MFDIGFWELTLILMLALLVLGPERLPQTARTLGRWTGQARQLVSTFQEDVSREVGQVRQDVDPDNHISRSVGQIREDLQAAGHSLQDNVTEAADKHKQLIDKASDIKPLGQAESNSGKPDEPQN